MIAYDLMSLFRLFVLQEKTKKKHVPHCVTELCFWCIF
ncbi:hypothetical protein TFKS16_2146 [Tannerella forsythia KS16]|nr:hypothetical protein TFKS16_2146 [Tannerella forsythia KS16]